MSRVESSQVPGGRTPYYLPEDFRFPVVLKPEFGTGSANTVRVETPEGLHKARLQLPDAFPLVAETFISHGQHPAGSWLADMVSVDSLACNGSIQHFGIADRFPLAPPFRESGAIFPSLLPDDDQVRILKKVEDAIRALGIDDAAVHTELRAGSVEPEVIEVNARLGGFVDTAWSRLGVGHPLESALRVALGKQPYDLRQPEGYVVLRTVHLPVAARRLIGAPTTASILEIPGVWRVNRVNRPNDLIDTSSGMSSRVFDVWIMAPTPEAARVTVERVDDYMEQAITYV